MDTDNTCKPRGYNLIYDVDSVYIFESSYNIT